MTVQPAVCREPRSSIDWLAGLDARDGWGRIIVRLLRAIAAKNELISVALTRVVARDRQLAKLRREHAALQDEYRRFRERILREDAA